MGLQRIANLVIMGIAHERHISHHQRVVNQIPEGAVITEARISHCHAAIGDKQHLGLYMDTHDMS